MPPVNRTSRDPEEARAPTSFVSKVSRALAVSCLIAFAALACLYSPEASAAYFTLHSFAPNHAQAPSVTLTPERNSLPCPEEQPPSNLRLDARTSIPKETPQRFTWEASGGRLNADGPVALWDLSNLKPGVYTATVRVTVAAAGLVVPTLSDSVKVVVNECRTPPPTPTPTPAPSCPAITLSCPKEIAEGQNLPFTATVNDRPLKPHSIIAPEWSVSAGTIVSRDKSTLVVSTDGLGGKTIRATYELNFSGLNCPASCETFVTPKPTPTPTSTPTPTITPTPTPTLTPTPVPSPSATPSASPTPPALILPASPEPPTPAPPTPPGGEPPAKGWFTPWRLLALLGLAAVLIVVVIAVLGGLAYMLTGNPGKVLSGGEATLDDVTYEGGNAGASANEGEQEGSLGAVAGATRKTGDDLHCTVFAPPEARPGDMVKVQVFAHLAEQAKLLAALAARRDDEARQLGSEALAGRVERGTELTFTLDMPGLAVEPAERSLVWKGEPDCVRFTATVPEDCRPKVIWGTVEVLHESVPVGQVEFKFRVVADAAPATAPPDTSEAEQKFLRYRKAFISYSRTDSELVLEKVQMLEAENFECFMDVMTLRPGENWEKMLYYYIDKSDVFFLFWSEAAKKSPVVENETLYALKRREMNAPNPVIKPIPIEGPPVVKPPPYLSHLHFDDRFRYFIKAKRAERGEEAGRPDETPGVG